MSRHQDRIDRTSNFYTVLRFLVLHQRPNMDGIHWDITTISSNLKSIREPKIAIALLDLQKEGYVERIGHQWFRTTEGINAYHQEARSVTLPATGIEAFREEVLTGSKVERGRLVPTDKDTAVLPNSCGHGRRDNTEERDQLRNCTRGEKVRRIAVENGVTDEQCREMLASGEIHLCECCQKYSRFHADKRPGHDWQSPCISCRKARRR